MIRVPFNRPFATREEIDYIRKSERTIGNRLCPILLVIYNFSMRTFV